MIASFIDGRVRIRRQELKDPATMELVMGLVRNQEGILDARPNPRTGSLLVTYDPEKISRESLLEAAAALEKQLGPVKGAATRAEKAGQGRARAGVTGFLSGLSPLEETGLLAGLYGLTVLSGFTSRRVHIMGATLFTGLAMAHVYSRRKWLG